METDQPQATLRNGGNDVDTLTDVCVGGYAWLGDACRSTAETKYPD
jgi:hypothetical protein